ncbi:MAG: hypothetical protein ACXVCP_05995 [Bdellovibrio sp.]
MKYLVCTLMALFLSACASKDLALKADKVSATSDAKLNVTAEVISDYSDDYNILLQFNFHSNDGKWLRVDEAEISFDTDNKNPFNVIVGKDLVTWAEAKYEEKKIDEHNEQLGSLTVAAVGGAAAVAGILYHNKDLSGLGVLAMGGASGYDTYSKIKRSQKNAQGVKLVPEGHLYLPFTIPSMTLSKRWALINCPTGLIGRILKLRLKTVEGDSYIYNIDLNG